MATCRGYDPVGDAWDPEESGLDLAVEKEAFHPASVAISPDELIVSGGYDGYAGKAERLDIAANVKNSDRSARLT